MATPFICIGAQKAGTTWLYVALNKHPDIRLAPFKELHYFDEKWVPTGHYRIRLNSLAAVLEKYRTQKQPYRSPSTDLVSLCDFFTIHDDTSYKNYLIRHSRGSEVFGEVTPDYVLLPPEGFANIQDVLPEVRMLYILRDPVFRYWSQLRMMAKQSGKPPEAHADFNGIPKLSDYPGTLKAIAAAGIHNLKVVLYEDLFADPVAEIGDILSFLGLDREIPETMRSVLGEVIHQGESAQADDEFLRRLRDHFAPVYDYIRAQGFKIDGKWLHA